jgi:hypothetical protein
MPGTKSLPGWLQLRQRGTVTATHVHKFAVKTSGKVDLDLVLNALGIELICDRKLECDGHCLFSLGSEQLSAFASITVNTSVALARQRLTIAHEIGHIMLHAAGPLYRDIMQLSPSSSIEVEANRFAVALLMPTADMREFLKNRVALGLNILALAGQVAELYGVSVRAAEARLQALSIR